MRRLVRASPFGVDVARRHRLFVGTSVCRGMRVLVFSARLGTRPERGERSSDRGRVISRRRRRAVLKEPRVRAPPAGRTNGACEGRVSAR